MHVRARIQSLPEHCLICANGSWLQKAIVKSHAKLECHLLTNQRQAMLIWSNTLHIVFTSSPQEVLYQDKNFYSLSLDLVDPGGYNDCGYSSDNLISWFEYSSVVAVVAYAIAGKEVVALVFINVSRITAARNDRITKQRGKAFSTRCSVACCHSGRWERI